MSPTDPLQNPQPGVGRLPDDVGQQTAVRPGDGSGLAGRTGAMTEAGPKVAVHEVGTGNPGRASVAGAGQIAGLPFDADVLDRLSQRLTMAGLRLGSRGRRLGGGGGRGEVVHAREDTGGARDGGRGGPP